MKEQLEITEKHSALLRACMKAAGYPAALARECKCNRVVFQGWDVPGKRLSWRTWIEIVSYARRSGIVGRYYDPITLEDPPTQDITREAHEAAWMLDHLPADERQRLMDQIAAAYGRAVARAGDDGEGRAGGVA